MALRAIEKSELNIVPFIGVMLTLLIVLMVAAPRMVRSLETPMGIGDYAAPPPPAVFVALLDDGTIWVASTGGRERAGNWSTLPALLRENSRGDRNIAVYMRADAKVRYADVVRLFDEIRAAGYSDVRIIGEDVVE